VDGVLQFILIAMAPRSEGISHIIIDRCSKGWPQVPVEDPGPEEYLYNCLEFHPPWMWDSLDPASWGGGDAQVSQQSMKAAGGDRGFNTKWFPFVSTSVQLLTLIVTQGRVLLVVLIFIIDVMVLLLLLLLSRCALSYRATRYH
jgi:hypothetical protein